MHILHVLRVVDGEGAGIQTYMASVAAALDGSGAELALGGLWPGWAPTYRADLRYMGRPGVSRICHYWQFWCWLRRDVPATDVVHIHNVFGAPLLLGAIACWLARVPYVVSPHGRLVAEAQALLDWRHWLYWHVVAGPILRRAGTIVVTTGKDQADLKRMDKKLKVRVIPPGLPGEIAVCPPTPAGDGLRIAFVGRLVPLKNVPTLLRAVALLRSRGIKATLDIIGWFQENHEPEIQALLDELGVREAVRFHGKLRGESKDAILRSVHVLAMPSMRENFSFVTAEALTLGIPVVVSADVGLAPIVSQYGCGKVVPSHDVSAWADALLGFADPEVQTQSASRALLCAKREFSLDAMRAGLMELYRQVVKAQIRHA